MKLLGQVRIRLLLGDEIAMGPGKADLLDAILRTGSISAAAKSMQMSYRRAWILVDTMNACFDSPLVDSCRGGAGGGGATVTTLGLEILSQYRTLQDEVRTVVDRHLGAFPSRARRVKAGRTSAK